MNMSVVDKYQKLLDTALKRIEKAGKNVSVTIQVGSATCENAAGAQDVWQEFERNIAASGRKDIQLHRVGCTGRCSREPLVGVLIPGSMPAKYQQVNRDSAHEIFRRHVLGGVPVTEMLLDQSGLNTRYQLITCATRQCKNGANINTRELFQEEIERAGLPPDTVGIECVGGLGFCQLEQAQSAACVLVRPDNTVYFVRDRADVARVAREHLLEGRPVGDLACQSDPIGRRFFDLYGDVRFFNRQNRIALRNAGVINPENIDEYLRYNGFRALSEALAKDDPDWVIGEVTESRLRGRGGGGFPSGVKWQSVRAAPDKKKYVICNADEGDPGAFMDRSMLESDPFSVIEGMLLAGFAVGAQQGFFYVRAEYPLAIRRIEHGLAECRALGLLGRNILGSGFSMDLQIRLGAGAFVCGEETALIQSIEGERGQPRIRPPFPTEHGLWGKPTVINNVETFANVPPILVYGSTWFKNVGSENSGGTKVFALAGKVCHTGLVEVPMGASLREVVDHIGGGVPGGKQLKAVQTGGPAGGVIPAEFLDTPIDFDTLGKLGSIMGSGGMIVLDEDDCMVDMARFFMEFCQDESCGKCTPCREGAKRMLEILERLTRGKGALEDLDVLERLARLVKNTSLCGLGRAAPNPVLSAIRYFRAEYEAHARDKSCPARKCKALLYYEIDPTRCVGCAACARNCPAVCISGARKEPHLIDQARCIKCGRCFEACRFEAVSRR